jgi:Flp pilus assembly protein TadD
MNSSQQDERITRYESKVAENPENELARFSLGKALFDAGRYAEAETHLKAALGKREDWMVVVILLAQCAEQRADKDEARSLFTKALELAVTQHHEGPEAEIRASLAALKN